MTNKHDLEKQTKQNNKYNKLSLFMTFFGVFLLNSRVLQKVYN